MKNIHTFAGEPGDYGQRYKPVMEAALMNPLPDANKLQYFRAMVSEEERLDIAEACYAEGFDEGKAKGLEQMAEAMRKDGMYEEDIQRILSRAKEG